ncbi:uncharacterized protein LOC109834463 isoform X2 [Asparagus officinalis]|uniref:uncharacterized protein LOC109834463 isoform X2 n=1 Tax=Asparagus officinalis TaxID=4686 RepID=UPI00098E715F|nr:uncharacterized protein LOC109834463 isoform X2 [Asparagus officinalis]
MGRRKPKTLRISAKWRSTRGSGDNKKKSNNSSDERRHPKSEKADFSSNKSISHVGNNTNSDSRGTKRRLDERKPIDSSHSAKNTSIRKRTRRRKKHNSLDLSNHEGSHRDTHLSKVANDAHEIRSESNDVKRVEPRKRRRRKKRRTGSGAPACDALLEEPLRNSRLKSIVVKETVPVEGETLSPLRELKVRVSKKLLVLDLNGLLCDVVYGYPNTQKPHERVGKSAVFKRPFCDDFMEFCCERFNIGVWSSRLKINVDGVVNFIMRDIKDHLLFCWDASQCTYTGFKTLDDRNKPLVLKQLKKLWNKEGDNLPWEKGDYSPVNTLLIDDSPYKALCNPPFTGIFPCPYSYNDENDCSLGSGGDLRVYLEGLAFADDVQCYVQQHPFGRHAITSENSSWKYYEQVVNKINNSSA